MSTQKPCVVGYLKTDDFAPIGSPYGVNQQPAAGTVAADLSTFFSSTPATDNTPGGTASFMFLQTNVTGTAVSKVLPRQFIICDIRALKGGVNGGAGDKATLSKVSADGLTTTVLGDLALDVNANLFVTGSVKFTPNGAFTPNLGAGETLKVTATNATNCGATIYIDVIGA